MSSPLHVAKTGLTAQNTRMSVISNNLANVNTVGFKADRANFETLLYQNVRQVGSATSDTTQMSTGLHLGTGVRVAGTEKKFIQGNLMQTNNSLDLAVNGSGFFQVLMPDGTMGYTRDGAFKRDGTGALVTSSGYRLEPTITIPAEAVSINVSQDGIVSVKMPGQTADQQVGNITLANFPNVGGLQPVGENFLIESPSSGGPIVSAPNQAGMGKLEQGSLEASNVSIVSELVDMIETQRAYEVNSKAISAVDGMMRFITNNT